MTVEVLYGADAETKISLTSTLGKRLQTKNSSVYHAHGNKYMSNSHRFFDVNVFVLNSNSLTKRVFARMCIPVCYNIKSFEKRRVCVSNSTSMVLRIFHICVCVLNS